MFERWEISSSRYGDNILWSSSREPKIGVVSVISIVRIFFKRRHFSVIEVLMFDQYHDGYLCSLCVAMQKNCSAHCKCPPLWLGTSSRFPLFFLLKIVGEMEKGHGEGLSYNHTWILGCGFRGTHCHSSLCSKLWSPKSIRCSSSISTFSIPTTGDQMKLNETDCTECMKCFNIMFPQCLNTLN
jgi:hypothetical protein